MAVQVDDVIELRYKLRALHGEGYSQMNVSQIDDL